MRIGTYLAALTALVATGVVSGGCKRRPERATVERVTLSLPVSVDADAARREAIRTAILEQLDSDDLTRVTDDASDATHLVRVEAFEDAGSGTGRVVVELQALEGGRVFENAGQSDAGSERWVVEAFEDAWSLITTHRMLQVASERDVLAALKSKSPRVQLIAIELIGERKIQAGMKPLTALVQQENNEVLVLRAVGALIALGDDRAIEPLIALTRHKPPSFVLQIVFAVASIGGPTAQGYLVTLASGHPNEAVRRGAEDALAELERR